MKAGLRTDRQDVHDAKVRLQQRWPNHSLPGPPHSQDSESERSCHALLSSLLTSLARCHLPDGVGQRQKPIVQSFAGVRQSKQGDGVKAGEQRRLKDTRVIQEDSVPFLHVSDLIGPAPMRVIASFGNFVCAERVASAGNLGNTRSDWAF